MTLPERAAARPGQIITQTGSRDATAPLVAVAMLCLVFANRPVLAQARPAAGDLATLEAAATVRYECTHDAETVADLLKEVSAQTGQVFVLAQGAGSREASKLPSEGDLETLMRSLGKATDTECVACGQVYAFRPTGLVAAAVPLANLQIVLFQRDAFRWIDSWTADQLTTGAKNGGWLPYPMLTDEQKTDLDHLRPYIDFMEYFPKVYKDRFDPNEVLVQVIRTASIRVRCANGQWGSTSMGVFDYTYSGLIVPTSLRPSAKAANGAAEARTEAPRSLRLLPEPVSLRALAEWTRQATGRDTYVDARLANEEVFVIGAPKAPGDVIEAAAVASGGALRRLEGVDFVALSEDALAAAGVNEEARASGEMELLEEHAELLHRVSMKLSNLPYPRDFVLPQSLFNEGARLRGPEMQPEVRDYILRMLPIHELGGSEYEGVNAENLDVHFANQIWVDAKCGMGFSISQVY
jgi:hypothetical protein